MMNITTQRLILRPFQASDFAQVAQLLSDPEVMQFSLNGPYSKQKSMLFINQCILKSANNEPSLLAVINKKNNHFIGCCGYSPQKILGKEELELGYRLLKNYWGKGLATEAGQAMKTYAFTEMGLTRLISLIDIENKASVRVAVKNGFKLEKQMLYNNKIAIAMYVAMHPGK